MLLLETVNPILHTENKFHRILLKVVQTLSHELKLAQHFFDILYFKED